MGNRKRSKCPVCKDNIYASALIVDSGAYRVHGRRGTHAMLTLQVLDGYPIVALGRNLFAIDLDADGDAFPDVDEGIPGVSVTLTWAGADASSPADDVVYATVTDQFGAYTFAGLPAGAFTIAVDTSSLPSGLTNAFDPDGGLANSASIILVTGE